LVAFDDNAIARGAMNASTMERIISFVSIFVKKEEFSERSVRLLVVGGFYKYKYIV
jgi:hypothetical protein